MVEVTLEKVQCEAVIQGQEKNPGQKKKAEGEERDVINSPLSASGTTTGNTWLFLNLFLQPPFFISSSALSQGHVEIIVQPPADGTLHV